jgi:hypothetical protein
MTKIIQLLGKKLRSYKNGQRPVAAIGWLDQPVITRCGNPRREQLHEFWRTFVTG